MSEHLGIRPVDHISPVEGETIFAIVRSKHSEKNSVSSSSYVQISIGKNQYALIVFAGLVLFHVVLSFTVMSISERGTSLEKLIVGGLFAQPQLLGLWLAISPWQLWKRVVTIGVISAVGCYFLIDEFLMIWFLIIGTALVFALPRIAFGWRIDFRPELPLKVPSFRSGGSIGGILIYVLACAVLLGAVQFSTRANLLVVNREGWLEIFSYTLPSVLLNAVCGLGILCTGSRAAKAVAIGVVAAFVSVVLAMQTWAISNNTYEIALCALGGLPIFVGTLFLLRKLGWRLYQHSPKIAAISETGRSFDMMEDN
jgi:hypothetical protein